MLSTGREFVRGRANGRNGGWMKLQVLALLLLFMGTTAYADTYHYKGADGSLIFTDDPSKIPRKPGKVTLRPDGAVSTQPQKKAAVSASVTTKPAIARKETPVVRRSSAYYEIGGRTFQDIRREMYYRSPGSRLSGKRVAIAWCEWSLGWVIHTIDDGTMCRIDAVDTRLDVTITMPRWVNYSAAPDGMKAAWDNYYQALLKHEEAHSDYGIAAARDIQRRLPELMGRHSCTDLTDDGTQLAKKILKVYREKDEEHDRTSLNSAMVTDVEIAADQREGVLGRQHPERQGLPAH